MEAKARKQSPARSGAADTNTGAESVGVAAASAATRADTAAGAALSAAPQAPISQVGQLVGFKDNGRTPLVVFSGQPGSAALPARATVDLRASHIGSEVVLTFEGGDALKPIVLGVLRAVDPNQLAEQPGHVELEADGERMFVSAKEQLVLRCGKAMITLTKAGKILIEGTYVSSRSSGVYRIKGGSVQLN